MKEKGLLIIILCLLPFASCVGRQTDLKADAPLKPLLWPETPQKPRIRYTGSVYGPEDFGIKRTFLRRMLIYITGNTDSGFIRTYGIAVDHDFMVIADPGAKGIHMLDRKDNSYMFLERIGQYSLGSPIGVAIHGDRVYVSDSERNIIFIIDRRGRPLGIIGEGPLIRKPTGIALWKEMERLYVSDTGNHRICAIDLSRNGKPLFFFGRRGSKEGEFNFPTNLWFDERRNRLLVSDSMNFRVQIFNPDGEFIGSFGEAGDSSGYFARPRGIATDSDGNIYVVDALFDAIQVFNEEGELLLFFGKRGEEPGEFWLPAGIFIDEKDRIFITDSYNRRVQIFEYLH